MPELRDADAGQRRGGRGGGLRAGLFLLGALVTALDVAARNGGLPGPDQTAFLLRG